MSISVPNGVNYRQLAVAGSGVLKIGDRAKIVGPNGGYADSATTSSASSRYGYDSKVGNITSTGTVDVLDRAEVTGSIVAGKDIFFGTNRHPTPAQGNVTLTGSYAANADIATKPITRGWDVPFDLVSNNLTITSGTTNLAPGSYGHLNVQGGTLGLRSGTYYVDRITLEPNGRISVTSANGPVLIYVRTAFIHHGTWTVTSPEKVLLGYFGTNLLALERTFAGTVVAPNGKVRYAVGNTPHTGSVFGKEVELDPGVTFTFKPFSRWDLFPTIDEGGPIGGPIAPTVPPEVIQGDQLDCYAPSFSTTTVNGEITSIETLPEDLDNGVCAPRFCDANDNLVPTPTDEELNTPPPEGSTCPAVGSAVDCPIDPTTLTNACSSDEDCTGGAVCAATCVDVGCTTIERKCGMPAASCSALPAEGTCQEYHLCPLDGAVGTPNPGALASALAPTSMPGAEATIPPEEVDAPKETFKTLQSARCVPPQAQEVETKDGSSKPAEDGNEQWGVYLEPVTDFGVTPVKRSDGIGELRDIHGKVGIAAGGILLGNKVEVFSADIGATADDCGLTFAGTVKLFKEAVVAITPSAAQTLHVALNDDGTYATPALQKANCESAREATKNAIRDTRSTYLLAQTVKEYYADHKLTPALCSQIKHDLPNRAVDANGNPVDCSKIDPSLPEEEQLDPIGRVNVVNAWKEEYDGKVQDYLNFADSLQSSRQAIQTSGTINLFDTPHPYHLQVIDQDIPVGPVTVNVAIEGYGFWNVSGGIQVGVGIDGNFEEAIDIVGNALEDGQAPKLGDIRAFAGPVVTPAAGVGVLAFAGVGFPGVSIGLEGKIDLLTISLPSGIVAAAMRVSVPDGRSTAGTPYDGTPKPGMLASNYKWVTGWNWEQKLKMSELSGQLNLAARVRILFFKKTFRFKLFDWPGFTQEYTLVGTGGGDALSYFGGYGEQTEDIAYSEIPEVDTPELATGGPAVPGCVSDPK